jgi:ribonuclease HI
VLIDPSSGNALERAAAVRETTNNRMEMQAAIEAMKAVKAPARDLLLLTDSKYLINSCTLWMRGWKAAGWRKKRGELLNVDLLKELDHLMTTLNVQFRHVRGHSGDPGNEHVDAVLNDAMDRLERGDGPRAERRFVWSAGLPD